jgi:hypothetical protein
VITLVLLSLFVVERNFSGFSLQEFTNPMIRPRQDGDIAFSSTLLKNVMSLVSSASFLSDSPSNSTSPFPMNDDGSATSTVVLGLRTKNATKDHPFAGARDEHGWYGYVPDLTELRRRTLKQIEDTKSDPMIFLPMNDEEQGAVCNETVQDEGFQLLTKKVRVTPERPAGPKILCAVYTYEGKHSRAKGVAETWGWRCDGFLAASNKTDSSLGAVDVTHAGNEEYGNMIQKVRSIWGFLYDNYLEDYDFFHICGDDTHMIVENFRFFLSKLDTTYPLYLGEPIPNRKMYNGGGPGYTLSRLALRMLGEALGGCAPGMLGSWEDRLMATCLFNVGITPNTTASVDMETGEKVYHGKSPHFVATFNPGISRPRNPFFAGVYRDCWWKFYGVRIGENLTSANSVAFHELNFPEGMKRHHATLYRKVCPIDSELGKALARTTHIV